MANIDSMNVGGQKSMIEDAAGRNMQSDAYDGTKIYSKEDICIYDNKLYEANQDITTAEVFNKAHWTESTLGSILERHRDSISGLDSIFFDGAGAHNSIYRGKNLGTSVTSVQYDEIDAGTFKDLYIGDYWEINGITYRIAAFDYFLGCTNASVSPKKSVTKHHITIMPDETLAKSKYTSSHQNVSYMQSLVYTNVLSTLFTYVSNAFGSSHILKYEELLSSGTDSTGMSAWSWEVSPKYIQLPCICMVSGVQEYCPTYSVQGCVSTGYGMSQLPLFALNKKLIPATTGYDYWVRDLLNSMHQYTIRSDGFIGPNNNNIEESYIRPYFSICKSN